MRKILLSVVVALTFCANFSHAATVLHDEIVDGDLDNVIPVRDVFNISASGTYEVTGSSATIGNFGQSDVDVMIFDNPGFGRITAFRFEVLAISGGGDVYLNAAGHHRGAGSLHRGLLGTTSWDMDAPLAVRENLFISLNFSPDSMIAGSVDYRLTLGFEQIAAVPLPAGLPLMLAALAGLSCVRRRKQG